ncbi:MAG: hypothetical protein WBC04_02630 [Candidatus Acidiferrales bacterium]
MESILAIGEVASAVLVSFSIAFLLEWLGLRGLMRLMPTTAMHARVAASAGNESPRPTRAGHCS